MDRIEKLKSIALKNNIRKWIYENKEYDPIKISKKFDIPKSFSERHLKILKRVKLI